MQSNGFIGIVIGVIVSIIVITAVAIPIFSGIQLGNLTTVDLEGERYSQIEDPVTITVVNNDSSGITLKIDDKEQLYTDAQPITDIVGYLNIRVMGSLESGLSIQIGVTTTSSTAYPILKEESESATIGSNYIGSKLGNFDLAGPVYIKDDSGGYVLFTGETADIPVSMTFIGLAGATYGAACTFENGVIVQVRNKIGDDISSLVNTEPFDVEDGFVKAILPTTIQTSVFDITALIVPQEDGEISNIEAAINSILDIIPILMIAGLIIGVAGTFLYRRLS